MKGRRAVAHARACLLGEGSRKPTACCAQLSALCSSRPLSKVLVTWMLFHKKAEDHENASLMDRISHSSLCFSRGGGGCQVRERLELGQCWESGKFLLLGVSE